MRVRASVWSVTVAAVVALCSAVLTGPVQAAPGPPGSPAGPVERRIAAASDLTAAERFLGGGPPGPVRVVRGLNNPRQLTLLARQGLLVAEAGRGGDTEVPSPFTPSTFVGPTGSVSWVPVPGVQEEASPIRIVQGLLSSADADGSYAIGSNGVGARRLAEIDIPVTYQSHELVEALPDDLQEQAGTLLRTTIGAEPRVVADLARWEIENDPDDSNDTGDTISNPYAALAQRTRTLVADAGGNTVVAVDRRGDVSLFALLPDPIFAYPGEFDSDAVPTSLAEDRDGTIYVGTLASAIPDQAAVLVYGPDGGQPLDVIEGFSFISGVAVGRDGSLYVSELFFGGDPTDLAAPVGQVTKVAPNGERTAIPVPFPGGVAVDRWNNVYVSAWSIAPADGLEGPDGTAVPDTDGQIWRLRFS